MKSSIVKRSVVIQGHKTSVSLEQPFWDTFRDIAEAERVTTSALLRKVDAERQHSNLSSAIRVFVLQHMREVASASAPPPANDGQAVGSPWISSPRVSSL
jgi:predicted DNA-binding ribbon-helix-helix protein